MLSSMTGEALTIEPMIPLTTSSYFNICIDQVLNKYNLYLSI